MVGDGFCNDKTNIEICNHDGGDCCLKFVNKDRCSECKCYLKDICATGFHPLVGDGYCNDETNNQGKKNSFKSVHTILNTTQIISKMQFY